VIRTRAAWVVTACAFAAGAAAVLWGVGALDDDRGAAPPPAPPIGALTPPPWIVHVTGNPGWEALQAVDRRRAASPLSAEARAWLRANGPVVVRVARRFDVSPVALGGIVAAEKTLLVGRADAIAEELFQSVFGTLDEAELERWVARREAIFQRAPQVSRGGVKDPYLWTLGPAQVSFRLAIRMEPVVARKVGRPVRAAHDVVEALTDPPGNLEYAAALVAEAQHAYRDLAGMEIADNPGILATLYHVGAPTVRARRLTEENLRRRARGESLLFPQVNFYGAFVNLHADEIGSLLGVDVRGGS